MHLETLFDLIIKNGHVPVYFRSGVTSLVIKSTNKGFNDETNYRPVTIISVIAELFKEFIYGPIIDKLNTTGLQLDFVKGGVVRGQYFFLRMW